MIDWEIVSSFDDITHRCGQDRRAYRDSEEVFEGFVVPELWHPAKKIFFILTQNEISILFVIVQRDEIVYWNE